MGCDILSLKTNQNDGNSDFLYSEQLQKGTQYLVVAHSKCFDCKIEKERIKYDSG